MKKCIILILIFCTYFSYSQTIEEIVVKLEKNNMLMGSAVGYSAVRPEQYDTFETLLNTANLNDLLLLSKHKNGVIRAYSCWGLSKKYRSEIDWLSFLQPYLYDTQKISTMFGCIVSTENVGDFVLSVCQDFLSDEEISELYYLGITAKSPLYYVSSALMKESFTERFYDPIRAWALDNNDNAKLALAKYQKEQDRELVLSLREQNESFFFRAVSYYLNDSLKPYFSEYLKSILLKDGYSTTWRYFYSALAQFHDTYSIEQLNLVFGKGVNPGIRKYHVEYIYNAVKDFKDGFYDDLLIRIWNEYPIVSKDVVNYFYIKNKDLCLKQMLSSIEKSEEYFSNTESLELMIGLLIKNNVDIKDLYLKQISKLGVATFQVYFMFMDNYWTMDAEKVLIDRLKKETNGHVLIPIYTYFLEHESYTTKDELENIYKKTRSKLMDWTKKELDSLFASGFNPAYSWALQGMDYMAAYATCGGVC